MRMKLRHLLPVLLMSALPAHAATELDRPVLSMALAQDVQIWLQLDYFSPALDILNYRGKTGSTSSLDRYSEGKLGFRYGISDDLNIRYSIGFLQQHVSRATEPRVINSDAYSHDVKLQYLFYHGRDLHWAVELGYRAHLARPVDFFAIQSGNTLVTSTGQPVATLNARDRAWVGALRGTWELGDNWLLHAGVELRRVSVKTSMTSGHAVLQPFLASAGLQSTPWNETHALFQMALDWWPVKPLSMSLDYTHYQISRSGYIPRAGKADYSNQDQLDAYLTWHIDHHWSIYGHGRIYRHFVLGDVPMAYNQRVNHRFKDPFGFVSLGMNWTY